MPMPDRLQRSALRHLAAGLLAAWAALALAQTAPPSAPPPPSGNPNWPKRPFLALDSVAHSGRAGGLVLTPDHRRAVTVAFDSTIRVWDVATGELQQRFFLPKTSNVSTRLVAVDVSPDGSQVAVGGFEYRWTMTVVSLQTGRVMRNIADRDRLGTSVLAWSPDGRYIASGKSRVANPRGVRVHEAATGREVFRDTEFAGEITALQFRADGSFFASGWNDGSSTLRLYKPEGGGFRMAGQATPRWGEYRAFWDAAGKTILVGANARLDGDTLAELPYDLDRRNLPNGVGVARVLQMADGRFVGTTWSRHAAEGFVRYWKGDRRIDGYTEFRLPDPQIRDVALTRHGELLYMTEESSLAMVAPDGKLAWRVTPDVAQFEGRPGALRVTEAGQVALPISGAQGQQGQQGEREIAFDLANPGYLPVARASGWRAPVTTTSSLRVLAWEGSGVGTVNNARLPYQAAGERSVCVAVHTVEPALVYGTNWQTLTKASDDGKVLWRRFVGANVTAVNIIESRGLVVAATASGMLRVFRWRDGEPVASYYLQPASRRWIVVAGEGYYEAGTGAEDIAGWIVNPATHRVADFMPMSRFRGSLLMPGLGRKAWETGLEADAVKALRPAGAVPAGPAPVPAPAPAPVSAPLPAQMPAAPTEPPPEPAVLPQAVRLEEIPPRVEIVSPGFQVSTGERQLRIRLRAVTPEGAPVTQLRAMVASTSVASRSLAPAAQGPADDERELVVDLPPEDSEVRLIAENRFGASVPIVIRVSWTGARQQGGKGNLYVLAAGVSRYDNPEYNLGLAAKDARDFVAALQRQRGALYNDVVVQELLDKDASKDQVERGFEWLRQKMTARDTAIVFFAGHGLNDGGNYYFITRDADLRRLPQTAVPFDRIRAGLTSLPGRALIFVDTCHAGNVIGSAQQARDNTAAINHLASSENGLVVFASSTGAQQSQEDPSWGNGAFTKAVVEGLLGAADFKKRGRITYKGLDAYVSDRVDELTKGLQTPVTPVLQGVPDFAIAEVRRP